MKSYAEMDEMSADILKELGNIGTGNAITSLAQMMGIPLDISSPSLHLAQVQEIYTLLEQSQEVETGILVEIKGEITGMFLFFLNESFTNIVLAEHFRIRRFGTFTAQRAGQYHVRFIHQSAFGSHGYGY